MSTRVIFGIGNPGREYENTRHNIGFRILDEYAKKNKLKFEPGKGSFLRVGSEQSASPFFLVKPTTYVNLSGNAAIEFFDLYNIEITEFLVIADDINLPVGELRIRRRGGDGGHNGLYSLIYSLQSSDFPRIRFGIGNEFEEGEMADYVLSKFEEDTEEKIKNSINKAVDLIDCFISEGFDGLTKKFSKLNN